MSYSSLSHCLIDLEKHGHLIRIREEVDPDLEMAAIHLRVFEAGGPAVYYERVKGSPFPAVSNLFGNRDRVHFIFRHTWRRAEEVVKLKEDPLSLIKKPGKLVSVPFTLLKALPVRSRVAPVTAGTTKLSLLPQIKSWPDDGGPFVTLPQVFTEDPDKPGLFASNLGMYRIQLGGNEYIPDQEAGLHYQIHRGIGVHQEKYRSRNQPMKVSVFVGGPPAHTLAAVMPLPEGISELLFAGVLGNRRFRFHRKNGFVISNDADFVITGEVFPGENKPEGPFGDHLGYYSLKHPFPLMHVRKVYHRKNAVWPFTVVGRPPQEDTFFGEIIHELTGPAIPAEVPGLHAVHAVDAAGVHPLLLATGSERYTPYYDIVRPQELLTIANHVLGSGQLSLAKYLFIVQQTTSTPSVNEVVPFFRFLLERFDPARDLHFYTKTTIDTLDYSGEDINSGSKLVIAAVDNTLRSCGNNLPEGLKLPEVFNQAKLVMPGVLAVSGPAFESYDHATEQMDALTGTLSTQHVFCGAENQYPLVIVCDDASFVSASPGNFIWTTFTRSNPSHDVYGVNSFHEFKHWGCKGSVIIDARTKPHHAPALIKDPAIERRVDALAAPGGSLHGII